jgi:hypothetical protein
MQSVSDQDIYISPVGFVKRAVYDLRSDAKWRIQTGYILYGINIAVWRPYDPEDISIEAEWHATAWMPIYVTSISFEMDENSNKYETRLISVDENVRLKLPITEVDIVMELKEYLHNISQSELAKSEAEMAEWRAEMRSKYGPAFGGGPED